MSAALAILTYVDAARPPAVAGRLPEAIESLRQTSYSGTVFIVDDGSTSRPHREYLRRIEREHGFAVIRRTANGGISRAKNTCLRLLLATEAETLFLAEDDILFREGWEAAYAAAMRRSGIEHFSWYLPDMHNRVMVCNGELVTATTSYLGLLMTFTRRAVQRVGGFKVLPHRYGFEHIHWTMRAVLAGLAPFAADIADSDRFIERSQRPSSLEADEIRIGTEMNRDPGCRIERLYEPFEE